MARTLLHNPTPPTTTTAVHNSGAEESLYPIEQAQSSRGLLVSYHHFSNLRSKVPGDDSHNLLQETDSMTARNISPSPCTDCVVKCDSTVCKLADVTKQCTDQCVVVPCSDPTHIANVCVEGCAVAPCEMQPCSGGVECMANFDDLLECCTDYHSYCAENTTDHQISPLKWDGSFDALFNTPNVHPLSAGVSQYYPSQPSNTGSTPVQTGFTSFAPNVNEEAEITAFLQTYAPHSNQMPAQHIQMPSPSQSHSYGTQIYDSQSSRGFSNTAPIPSRQNTVACQWANCNASFPSMAELVGHVNLAHLRFPSSRSIEPPLQEVSYGSNTHSAAVQSPISCQWADCQTFSTPTTIPGPSTENHFDMALNVLSSHLLEDHLGLSVSHNDHTAAHLPIYAGVHALARTSIQDERDTPTPPSSSSESPTSQHDCSASHTCQWEGCGKVFGSCEDLTAHISSLHVGMGRSQYQCRWAGCIRRGEQGFSSKQKILRHLQSHTGHRPFQCKICSQNFSEAATLQQHMRRHTQEKPYICDFPNCNKAFAITGALTIHKRTHNGEKPFKCTHCGRAFAESSNLSKHLRTHTGVRPYACAEPGCEKAFARPDQLARHAHVHEKKRKNESNAMQADE